METLLDLGAVLIAARRAQGMTQGGLGERVGASQQQVARWEARGYANVDLERVSRVAEALGVTPGTSMSDLPLAAESRAAYRAGGLAGGNTAPSRLEFSPAELLSVCRRRAVRRLALFGSVLRDDFGPDSDVDVLVEFDHSTFEDHEVHRLPDELRAVFGGRKIDLIEADSLSPRLRERVLAEAWYVYAA